MADKRSVSVRFRKWHVSDEATIDHLVRSLAPEAPKIETRVHDPIANGLCVEAQVRKTWNNPVIGLAIF